jgi:hypothetical protein
VSIPLVTAFIHSFIHSFIHLLQEFYAAKEVAEKARRDRERETFLQQLHSGADSAKFLPSSSSDALLFGRSGIQPELSKKSQHRKMLDRLDPTKGGAAYDYRHDINVLSHPRYAVKIKKMIAKSEEDQYKTLFQW